ncbi:MAG: ABC transporter substrate-binding protein [Akkermansia sp.]|nr:ABC transporter substrate-binding protein [Akkermansia sp.]
MKKRLTGMPLVALWGVLACLLLLGCKGREEHEGTGWQHPTDKSMPYAFAENDKVPVYARRWHAPQGFPGFPERWNASVRQHLRQEAAAGAAEAARCYRDALSNPLSPEARRKAGVQFRLALHRFNLASAALRRGEYLRFEREANLPGALRWQTGQDEPEIGSPEAKKGGTMRLALAHAFPNTLRPFGPNSNNSTRRYLYDDIDLPLVRLHPLTGHIIPGTADRWAVSEDGMTVYFHIDENARFSDGCKLTTRDFVTALFIRTSAFSGEPFFEDYYRSFAGITIYGNRTLAVHLRSPRPYAPYYAAIPACCTAFYAEFGADYPTRYQWRVPPTTGGYTLSADGVVPGRSLTLSRVRNWWAADRKYTRNTCNVDAISYSFIAEASKRRELFRLGQLDLLNGRNSDFWYEGLEIPEVHAGLIQRVQFYNLWPVSSLGIHLNCSKPPFDNKDFRKGFHHAMNIKSVIDTVFRGDAHRNGSYFSGFGMYSAPDITAARYDEDEARACFARAGYTREGSDGILCKPDGTRLQVTVSSRIDPIYANCMEVLRIYAARCGMDLRWETLDDTIFYVKVKDKQYSASIFSWSFSPPLPEPGLFFYSGDAYSPNGTPVRGTANVTATASSEIDAAILACKTAATEEQAAEANRRLQRLVATTYAWVPGWCTPYCRFAQWRWVCWPKTPDYNFCPPRYHDPLDSHVYWIDESLRDEVLRSRGDTENMNEQELVIPLPQNLH